MTACRARNAAVKSRSRFERLGRARAGHKRGTATNCPPTRTPPWRPPRHELQSHLHPARCTPPRATGFGNWDPRPLWVTTRWGLEAPAHTTIPQPPVFSRPGEVRTRGHCVCLGSVGLGVVGCVCAPTPWTCGVARRGVVQLPGAQRQCGFSPSAPRHLCGRSCHVCP